MNKRWLLSWGLLLLTFAPTGAGGFADSVVRVRATVRYPDVLRPWIRRKPIHLAGSGAVIENKRILTNAHIVLYADTVQVEGEDGKKVAAKITAVAPGIDLALLTVADDRFFARRPALPRNQKLPRPKALVTVYGFPDAGEKLAIVPSRVLRIEYVAYAPQTSGLQVHLEKLVDPGASGGPVMLGKYMAGLALSLGQSDPLGRVIPNEEIDLFLQDVKDARYDGKPWLHAPLQTLQNEALRKKLRLGQATEGLLVTRAGGLLEKFDIITKIGGYFVDNEGRVLVHDDLRFPFQYIVPQVAKGGKVRAGVLRSGEASNIDLPVTYAGEFLIRELNGKLPRYYLYGPIVFAPATIELTEQLLQLNRDPSNPLALRQNDKARFPGDELVVVSSVLPHKCLGGYPDPLGKIVREVSGVEVKSLAHLVDLLRDNKREFVTLEFVGAQPEFIVLQRADMKAVTQELMKKHDIPSRQSGN
jgi:hypothetical protein